MKYFEISHLLERIEVYRSGTGITARCTAGDWTFKRERTDLSIIVHFALEHLESCKGQAAAAGDGS